MFTGIVADVGRVETARRRNGLLTLEVATRLAGELSVGDSISVDGVCLTAVKVTRRRFVCEAMGETLARSTIGSLRKGEGVNLELPARLVDRLGGHLVQGHVDAVVTVTEVNDANGARHVTFAADNSLLKYIVVQGSLALNGVSLTVSALRPRSFSVALIPHTLQATTFSQLEVGSKVNVEVDVIAKYVERLVKEK